MSKKFQCAACGGEFTSRRDELEAEAEYDALFPGTRNEERVEVCHVCWLQMTAEIPPAEFMKDFVNSPESDFGGPQGTENPS